MTLVIAGHTYDAEISYKWGRKKGVEAAPDVMVPSGIFTASDSVLTAHGTAGFQPVLDGFRKSYSIPIKIWEPYFVDGYFHSYLSVQFESACVVAFAGSSLVAQHALNAITTHLGELRITRDSQHRYVVIRDCEPNNVLCSSQTMWWDDDTFLPSHYKKIITADDLSKHVEHSINVALKSAKKYKINQAALDAMRTDFVFGVQCPATNTYNIFVYRMNYNFGPDGVIVSTTGEKIQPGTVAVLGMRHRFESEAQAVFTQALEKGKSPEKEIFHFLNLAIDKITSEGSFEISRPSSLKKLRNGKLTLDTHRSQ